MKVNDRNAVGSTPEGARSPEARRVENSASSRTASSHGASGLDRVELSTAAEGISRALAVDSSERAARVSAIAMDYRAGRYHAGRAGSEPRVDRRGARHWNGVNL